MKVVKMKNALTETIQMERASIKTVAIGKNPTKTATMKSAQIKNNPNKNFPNGKKTK